MPFHRRSGGVSGGRARQHRAFFVQTALMPTAYGIQRRTFHLSALKIIEDQEIGMRRRRKDENSPPAEVCATRNGSSTTQASSHFQHYDQQRSTAQMGASNRHADLLRLPSRSQRSRAPFRRLKTNFALRRALYSSRAFPTSPMRWPYLKRVILTSMYIR